MFPPTTNERNDRFDSSFAIPNPVAPQEPVLDKVRFFLEDHGKQLVMAIVAIAFVWFVYDFFIGSYHPYQFVVTNAEGENVDAAFSISFSGSDKPFASFSNKSAFSVSLKPGDYLVSVSSDGYASLDETVSLTGQSPEENSLVLDQLLKSSVKSVALPQSAVFAGQSLTGTVVLSNRSSQSETVELIFEEAFEDFVDSGNLTVTVPAGQDVSQDFSLSIPLDEKVSNRTTGDALTGKVRIKYMSERFKEIKFTLAPPADVEIRPEIISKKGILSGKPEQELDSISIQNNSKFALPPFTISIRLDDPSRNSWITLSKETTIELAPKGQPNDEDSVIVYISPPALDVDTGIKGSSVLSVSSPVFSKDIALQIDILKRKAPLTATLKSDEVSVRKTDDLAYETVLTNELSITNKDTQSVNNVELSILPVECTWANWLNFETTATKFNLGAGVKRTIKLAISAPATAEAGISKTCQIRTFYDDPLSDDKIVGPSFELLITTR